MKVHHKIEVEREIGADMPYADDFKENVYPNKIID